MNFYFTFVSAEKCLITRKYGKNRGIYDGKNAFGISEVRKVYFQNLIARKLSQRGSNSKISVLTYLLADCKI